MKCHRLLSFITKRIRAGADNGLCPVNLCKSALLKDRGFYMTQKEMILIVKTQLSIDLNCQVEDFAKKGFVFCQGKDNPGRRPFKREESYLEMLTMGKGIIVSGTPDKISMAEQALKDKSRDEGFFQPFVKGHILYYLPDLEEMRQSEPGEGVRDQKVSKSMRKLEAIEGFTYRFVERNEISALYYLNEFENALIFDEHHERPDMLVMLCEKDGVIVGMAGAGADCEKMWQIGVDVLPPYRGYGLAAFLVNSLASEVLERGYIPYYGTTSSNIPSQRVAHRAGFSPAWMCIRQKEYTVQLPQSD